MSANPELPPPRTRIKRVIARARRPDKDHMTRMRDRVPYWFVAGFLFLFASYQIAMNPFGFSDLTQRYTQDVADLLITGPYFYPTTGHDKVSVALIDDQTLNTLQMPWPWAYGSHARALDTLLSYHPKAVVVDFLFVDPRKDDTVKDLVNEIKRYKAAGVPFYFTAATDTAPGQPTVRKEFADAGVTQIDPSIAINGGVARQYPVSGRCFGAEALTHQNCPSMALRAFRDAFPHIPVPPLEGMIELVWGTRTDPSNSKWMHVRGPDGKMVGCANDLGFFTRIFDAFFDPSAVRARCPYTSIIPADSLFLNPSDPDVVQLAHDRVVFYGGGLEGVEDQSFTPVNGLIPNVFIHAMALDNLISFNGQPQQNVVTVAGHTLDSNTAQVAAIVPVIVILSWIHRRRLARKRKREIMEHYGQERSATFEYFLDKAVDMAWHWFSFALALGAGLALTLAVGLSVANWVEVVFVSVELAAMLLVGVPDAIWGYLHHVLGGEPQPL